MKKLLAMLGAVGLIISGGASIVSCDNPDKTNEEVGESEITIDLKGDKVDLLIGDMSKTIKIINFDKLQEPAVLSKNEDIASIQNKNGVSNKNFSIIANGVGSTEVVISATGLDLITIKVNVTKPEPLFLNDVFGNDPISIVAKYEEGQNNSDLRLDFFKAFGEWYEENIKGVDNSVRTAIVSDMSYFIVGDITWDIENNNEFILTVIDDENSKMKDYFSPDGEVIFNVEFELSE
ncbi:lipoprotein [Spiroplasma endosymbiont of Othius punctulatus]|uniref:lipoprotein n=1 Tax=Spiroplasma endosymbiont of Othius punctulatus TaxID=3066289 RepID=UPI0030CDED62